MHLLYSSNTFWKAPWKFSCVSVSMTFVTAHLGQIVCDKDGLVHCPGGNLLPHLSSSLTDSLAILESLMPLKNWCSIHSRWSKSSLKHFIRFCGISSKFKTEFYCISFVLLQIVLLKCPHVQIAFLKFTNCENQALVGCIPTPAVAVHLNLKCTTCVCVCVCACVCVCVLLGSNLSFKHGWLNNKFISISVWSNSAFTYFC